MTVLHADKVRKKSWAASLSSPNNGSFRNARSTESTLISDLDFEPCCLEDSAQGFKFKHG
jgi:hypothetical protein